MIGGRIACDFCGFIGIMETNEKNKGTVSVPDGWVGIHPTVTVYGMRGLTVNDERYAKRREIKEKILKKVSSIHCCPACLSDRNVFDLQPMLPASAQVAKENFMKR